MLKKIVFCACLSSGIFQSKAQQVINFEDLSLPPDSFWNGSDMSGGFNSNVAHFPNTFVDYGGGFTAWDGFAYSNKINDTLQNFTNMYSCFAGHQLSGSGIFGVSYNSFDSNYQVIPTEITFSGDITPLSFWVTNSAFTALTIKNGDSFSKKFGGVSGDDPDWFRLDIICYNGAIVIDTFHFYLADYRFLNNAQDYIVKEWTEINLVSAYVTKIAFLLSSSDTGAYGMNTPAYFCFDNLYWNMSINILENKSSVSYFYPNPTTGKVSVSSGNSSISKIEIYNMFGEKVYTASPLSLGRAGDGLLDLSDFPSGIYFIKMKINGTETYQKIVKN